MLPLPERSRDTQILRYVCGYKYYTERNLCKEMMLGFILLYQLYLVVCYEFTKHNWHIFAQCRCKFAYRASPQIRIRNWTWNRHRVVWVSSGLVTNWFSYRLAVTHLYLLIIVSIARSLVWAKLWDKSETKSSNNKRTLAIVYGF